MHIPSGMETGPECAPRETGGRERLPSRVDLPLGNPPVNMSRIVNALLAQQVSVLQHLMCC